MEWISYRACHFPIQTKTKLKKKRNERKNGKDANFNATVLYNVHFIWRIYFVSNTLNFYIYIFMPRIKEPSVKWINNFECLRNCIFIDFHSKKVLRSFLFSNDSE